jgi:hypothetical protein
MDSIEELLLRAVPASSVRELEMLSPDTVAVRVPVLSDEVAAALTRFPGLRAVVHNGNSAITDQGVAYLAAIKTLQLLDLEWSTAISDESLKGLQRLTTLRWIDLSFCSRLSGAAIDEFARVLPNCEIET